MDIKRIVNVINEGGLVISPTDTVYGIMADAMDEEVIKKVFEVKKRPFSKPLILLMDSLEMIKEYTLDLSVEECELISKFLPGKLSIILKKNEMISDLITSGKDTVAIRIPDNKELLQVIRCLGRPIVSTSANISDNEIITKVDDIDKELAKSIDLIVDGGVMSNVSSTVVRFDEGKLVILREGELADKIRKMY